MANILQIEKFADLEIGFCHVQGRVVSKTMSRSFHDESGNRVKRFSFVLEDRTGQTIRVSAFRGTYERFYPIIKPKRSYLLRNVKVVEADPLYRPLDKLELRLESKVRDCSVEELIGTDEINFMPLSQL